MFCVPEYVLQRHMIFGIQYSCHSRLRADKSSYDIYFLVIGLSDNNCAHNNDFVQEPILLEITAAPEDKIATRHTTVSHE